MKQFQFQENRNRNQEEPLKSLNLVGKQLKILRFFGAVLPENFKIFVAAIIIFGYVVCLTITFALIPKYWTNIGMITKIFFEVGIISDVAILMVYLIFHQHELISLFHMIDTNFVEFINTTVSSTNKAKIIPQIRKKSRRFTFAFLGIFTAVIITWPGVPYFKKLIDTATEVIDENDDEEILNYFPGYFWIPKDPLTSPTYELWYLCEVLCVYMIVAHFTSCNMIFFFFMYYTAAHFDLLLSCIEDIDIKFPDDNIEDLEELTMTINNIYENKASRRRNSMGKRQVPVSMGENSQNIEYCKTTQGANDESVLADDRDSIQTTEKNKIAHLIECIKYHQAILEFSKKMNDFLSPMFLVYCLTSQLMMCVAVFQLIASKEVENALYGCHWYNHSQEFKKLLHIKLMRAQDPVKCTAGKFFAVSLESFADILNTVYAYFTIVKRMYES